MSCSEQEKCCCKCHEEHEHEETCAGEESNDPMIDWWLEVADEAWTEVLKDKIKEHILATQSDRMKELAKIISEGNSQRWKSKMEKKGAIAEFKEKLCQFFKQGKK